MNFVVELFKPRFHAFIHSNNIQNSGQRSACCGHVVRLWLRHDTAI